MKVYVGNLPFSVDDEKLREIFSKFGDIEEATIIKDKYSGRSKGFGFVTFTDDAAAKKAIAELNEKDVEGRNLKVNEARPMEDRPPRREFGNRGGGGGRDGGRGFGGGGGGRGRRF
jgi:RNA recognition motif-containing protein